MRNIIDHEHKFYAYRIDNGKYLLINDLILIKDKEITRHIIAYNFG